MGFIEAGRERVRIKNPHELVKNRRVNRLKRGVTPSCFVPALASTVEVFISRWIANSELLHMVSAIPRICASAKTYLGKGDILCS